MSNDNQAKTIGAHLRALVEESKAVPLEDAKNPHHPMYDRAIAGILRTVPEKPLAVDGQVLQPVEPHDTGTPLLDWSPDKEKAKPSLDQTLNDTKQRVSERNRGEKKGPDR